MNVAVKLADGTTLQRQGKINFADTRINTASGTYETRAEFVNKDNALKSGQFVRVILNGPKRLDAIAVPQAAVLDGPQGKFVYVAGKDKDGKDVALPKPVVLGDWVTGQSNQWIVESGLAAGDKVIVDGIAKIFMPGAPIKLASAPPAGAGAPAGGAPAAAPAAPGAAPAAAPAAAPDAAPAKAAAGAPPTDAPKQ
jgi:membrane fusion protein (multidrug efflux system)